MHAIRRAVRGIHEALWARRDNGLTWAWLVERSVRRTWWTTDGFEWDCIRLAPNYTSGHHIAQLLADKTSHRARISRKNNRLPHRCLACGHPQIAFRYASPSADTPGIEWCINCAPAEVQRHRGWIYTHSLMPSQDFSIPTCPLPPDLATLISQHPPRPLRTLWTRRTR